MRYTILLLPLLLLLAACGRRSRDPTSAPAQIEAAAEVAVAPTPAATPTTPLVQLKVPAPIEPTTPSTPLPPTPTPEPAATPLLKDNPIAVPPSFADFPGNTAQGEPAPDFALRLLDGTNFRLSEEISSDYYLVLPTTLGCGECLYSLGEVTAVFPVFRNRNIKVVVADIIPENEPEWWSTYAELFAEPDFIWGVVDSEQFLLDYQIEGLGTFLLIDPQGNLVFERRSPLDADEITQLLNLTQRQEVSRES